MADILTTQEDADRLFTDEALAPPAEPVAAKPLENIESQEDADALFSDDALAPPQSSMLGAAARSAELGVVPALTGIPAAAAGAEAGATVGALAGPVGAIAGGIVGGLGGMFVGAMGGEKLQDYALSKMSDEDKKRLGLDEQQRLVDEQQHPYASQLGGLVPYLVTSSPFSPKAVEKEMTALERFMNKQSVQRAMGGGLMGAWELGQEALNDEVDWTKVAVATAFGTIFNHQNRVGQYLHNIGARPVQRVTGRLPEEPPPPDEPSRSMGGALFSPRNMPDPRNPTLRELDAAGVMGPGNTEYTYMGVKRRPALEELFAHKRLEEEYDTLYGPQAPTPGQISATARKMEPELFTARDALEEQRASIEGAIELYRSPTTEQYNEVRGQIATLEEQLAGTKNKADQRKIRTEIRVLTGERDAMWSRMQGELEGKVDDNLTKLHGDLAAVNAQIREQGRDIARATRRASEALGAGEFALDHRFGEMPPAAGADGIAPELFTAARGSTPPAEGAPAAPAAPAVDMVAERAKIARDAKRELLNAGRSEAEADEASKLIAARFVARAASFQGARGTPHELYLADHARITKWEKGSRPPSGGETPPPPAGPAPEAGSGVMQAAEARLAEADSLIPEKTSISEKSGETVPGRLPEAPAGEAPAVEGAVSVMPEAGAQPAAEAPAAPVDAGPAAGDRIVMSGTPYRIEAIDDNKVSLTPTRKSDKASAITLPRRAFDAMFADHAAEAGVAEGDKITLGGEVLDPKLAALVKERLAAQEAAPADASRRLAPPRDEAALRARMMDEALKSDEEFYAPREEGPVEGALPSDDASFLKESRQKLIKEPQTLLGFIRGLGGIKDWKGELKSQDMHRRYPGLVNNKNGKALDYAREAATEAGYLPEDSTPDDLVQALLSDEPVYSRQDFDQAEAFKLQEKSRAVEKEILNAKAEFKDAYPLFEPEIVDEAAMMMVHDGMNMDEAMDAAVLKHAKSSPAWEPDEEFERFLNGWADAGAASEADKASRRNRQEESRRQEDSGGAENGEGASEADGKQKGVDGDELAAIADEFAAAESRAEEDGWQLTHVFDPPAKEEVVRIEEKARVYHKDHGWMTPEEAKAKIEEWKKNAEAQGKDARNNGNEQKIVLSLFDLTGKWSEPWEKAGYQVYRFDIQADENADVRLFSTEYFEENFAMFEGQDVYAVLAACPCTDFASSGARHFAAKDADGRTIASVKLVEQTLATIEFFKPSVWAVENPVGRIEKLGGLPPWRTSFNPNHFGDPYTKKTLLWGRFNGDMPIAPVEPTEGSKMHSQYGGKSQATKNARSVTPEGFAYAFFEANNAVDHPVAAIANKFDRLDRGLIERAVKAGATEEEITHAVEDHYYFDMDDAAGNEAVRGLIEERGGEVPAPTYEAGAEGKPQAVVPGAERISDKSLAERRASQPMRGGNEAPGGMFDEGLTAQRDIFDTPAAEQKPVKQTDTPEFKRFFEGSQVTDENGAPKRMYHGTLVWERNGKSLGDFNIFDRMASVKVVGRSQWLDTIGSWFSDNPGERGAGLYTGQNGAVYPVYLSIKKPLETSFQWMLDKAKELGPVITKKGSKETKAAPEAYENLRNWLIEQGYDGVHIEKGATGEKEFDQQNVWIALNPEQIKSATGNRGAFDPSDPNILFQNAGRGREERALGKIILKANGQREIWLKPEANPSTIIHETGHDFLEQLAADAVHEAAPQQLKDDLQTVKGWVGWKDGQKGFTTKQHEKFARGFERYLYDGIAPSKELAVVFQRFANWLREVYQTVAGLKTPEAIPADIRAVFDRLLAVDPHLVTVAGEGAAPRTIADTHMNEARTVKPERAGPMSDRAIAEADRATRELPRETRNELRAAAERAGVGESAVGLGDGAGRAGGLAEDRGGPAAISGGGASRAGDGAVAVGRGANENAGGGGGRGREAAGGDGGASGGGDGGDAAFGRDDGRFVDKAGNIRLENLTDSESVKEAIREIAYGHNGFITERRGRVADDAVLSLAEEIGFDGAEELVNRWVVGQAMNAEQIMALRLLVRESAADLHAKAKAVADGGDWKAVRDYAVAKERHIAVQRTVSGVTAEAGRALRAFRDISGGAKAKTIEKLMREATGQTLFQLRDEASLLAGLDSEVAINRNVRHMGSNLGEGTLEYATNNLISGPITHTIYTLSNQELALWKALVETPFRAVISNAMKAMGKDIPPEQMTRFGEVWQQILGMGQGFAPALKAASQSIKVGLTTRLPRETMKNLPGIRPGQEVVEAPMVDMAYTLKEVVPDMFAALRGSMDAIAAYGKMLAMGKEGEPFFRWAQNPLYKIPDAKIRGVTVPVGGFINSPSRLVSSLHAFNRIQFYFMELNAEAFRKASAELETGAIRAEDFDRRLAELKSSPDALMIDRASQAATESTQMAPGGQLTQRLSRFVNSPIGGPNGPPLMRFIDPFIHISSNVLSGAFLKRTPLGFLSGPIREDLLGKNGKLAQSNAMSRMMAGTSVLAFMGMMKAGGYITGSAPEDKAEAATWALAGYQPYSIKIDGTWYPYHRLGVLGLLMGIGADLYDVGEHLSKSAASYSKDDLKKMDEELMQAMGSLLHSISNNVMEESFMRGPAELMKAVEGGENAMSRYTRNFISTMFTPFSVGMSQTARMADPVSRQARTLTDAIKNKIPGMSQDLFPRRNLWGEPIMSQTTIATKSAQADPVSQEIYRLGIAKAPVERKIMGVELTDQQYDDYQRIAGRMAKMQIELMVRSPNWRSKPDPIKKIEVEKTIDGQREAARGLMMMKFREIPQQAAAAKRRRLTEIETRAIQ